ncbi:MAG: hypothetical protein A3E01_04630 [Gammaproteobacteria bacterium RIFCSPHIGHO2_12_FULL_63_22]|nr:MAG: hypothetical protein A3E01_04630 [Gammaproteobacteria bacterium RIFCSPHIGHO2_12_FULL_63_22]
MNNCARIIIGLSRLLHRQPTPEEYAAFVAELPQGEYMYVPDHNLNVSKARVRAAIVDKRAEQKSLRTIAREVGMSHEQVRQILASECQELPPTELTDAA